MRFRNFLRDLEIEGILAGILFMGSSVVLVITGFISYSSGDKLQGAILLFLALFAVVSTYVYLIATVEDHVERKEIERKEQEMLQKNAPMKLREYMKNRQNKENNND